MKPTGNHIRYHFCTAQVYHNFYPIQCPNQCRVNGLNIFREVVLLDFQQMRGVVLPTTIFANCFLWARLIAFKLQLCA